MSYRIPMTSVLFQKWTLAYAFERVLILLVQCMLKWRVLFVRIEVVNVSPAIAPHFNWTRRSRLNWITIQSVMDGRDVKMNWHVRFRLCIWLALVNAVQRRQENASAYHWTDVLVTTTHLGLNLNRVLACWVSMHNLVFLFIRITFVSSADSSKQKNLFFVVWIKVVRYNYFGFFDFVKHYFFTNRRLSLKRAIWLRHDFMQKRRIYNATGAMVVAESAWLIDCCFNQFLACVQHSAIVDDFVRLLRHAERVLLWSLRDSADELTALVLLQRWIISFVNSIGHQQPAPGFVFKRTLACYRLCLGMRELAFEDLWRTFERIILEHSVDRFTFDFFFRTNRLGLVDDQLIVCLLLFKLRCLF